MWTINRNLFTRSRKRKLHKVGASLFALTAFLAALAAGGYIGVTLLNAWRALVA